MTARELWRGLALEPLAECLGYRRDPRNRRRWKRPGSVLTLAGARFFDHACERGAIDLVMHVADCSFGAAVEFLERRYGLSAAAPVAASVVQPAAGPRLPPPHACCWPTVREFLRTARLGPRPVRALPPRLPALRRCPAQRCLRLPRPRRCGHQCRTRRHPTRPLRSHLQEPRPRLAQGVRRLLVAARTRRAPSRAAGRERPVVFLTDPEGNFQIIPAVERMGFPNYSATAGESGGGDG